MTSPAHPRVAEVARLLAGGRAPPARCASSRPRPAPPPPPPPQLGVAGRRDRQQPGLRRRRRAAAVLTSGAHRVDEAQVAALLGVPRVTPAPADFVRRHTGQAIGGVAPIGHPEPIGTLVDIELARYEQVWAAAGHPRTVFPTTYDELLRLTGGTAAEVGPVRAPRRRPGRGDRARPMTGTKPDHPHHRAAHRRGCATTCTRR